ncbi:MAG: methylated-DNA--[protein]-cysteine S-methyltransferase [Burkholderiales bacterium]
MQTILYSKFPLFNLQIILTKDCILGVDFLAKDPKLNSDYVIERDFAFEVAFQLDEYLKNPEFKFDLPLKIDGTVHQKKVWQFISTIPAGSTFSYGNLAKAVASSPRAVGSACGKNKLPIFIPCHRVVAANGSLGGFMEAKNGYSLLIKQWLLNHEATS